MKRYAAFRFVRCIIPICDSIQESTSFPFPQDVACILSKHQEEMVQKALELSEAEKKMKVVEQLAEYERKEAELKQQAKQWI